MGPNWAIINPIEKKDEKYAIDTATLYLQQQHPLSSLFYLKTSSAPISTDYMSSSVPFIAVPS